MTQTMTHCVVFSLCTLAAYLLGAIPFGLIIATCRGVDIRSMGSGNIGATNVFRSVGKTWGVLTFAADFLKGLISSMLIPQIPVLLGFVSIDPNRLAIVTTIAVVAGHNWPIYLGFRGGKGIAASAGALTGLAWQALLVGLAVWVIVFLSSRYVSLASIVSAVITAAAAWIFYSRQGLLLPFAMTMLAVWSLWRHHSNLERLIEGREHRFEFKRRTSGMMKPPTL